MITLNLILVTLSIFISVSVAGHALLTKRTPSTALGWIAVCLLFPVAGILLYFLFGINRVETRAKKLDSQVSDCPLDCGPYHNATADAALKAEDLPLPLYFSQIARISDTVTHLPLVYGNHIDVLHNGEAAYQSMLESIEQATRHIFLITYIFETNPTGLQFIDALGRAVDRGVSVKVIIDGVGEYYNWPKAGSLLKKRGVTVARFIRPRLLPLSIHINLRNHRKILITDGHTAYTGGMNIGGRHMAQNISNPRRVIDMHFRLTGPVVLQMEQTFLEDWAFCTGKNLHPHTDFHETAGNAFCRTIKDGPNEDINKLSTIIVGAISAARQQVMVMTPYFLPSVEMVSALQSAALRGVDVNIVLPGKNNLPFVAWATRHMLKDLLYRGVKVYFQPPPFVHTKLFVVDRHYAQVGSANFDPRSFQLNFELCVEIYEKRVAGTLNEHILEQIRRSKPVSLHEIKNRSLGIKIRDAVAWLFSPYL
ncbi:MAG: cardiolipin synthase [Thermodesulfobacteriota bacterium]|nr:cardiolipin synthase [Thermodesulfobacteriota bacterium]